MKERRRTGGKESKREGRRERGRERKLEWEVGRRERGTKEGRKGSMEG